MYDVFIGNAVTHYSFFGGSLDIAPMIGDRFSCTGNEYSLSQCPNNTNNWYHNAAIGVYCFGRHISNANAKTFWEK